MPALGASIGGAAPPWDAVVYRCRAGQVIVVSSIGGGLEHRLQKLYS